MAKRFAVEEMRNFMVQAFVKGGVPEDDAGIVADNLLYAELRGIKSHGISRFPVYLKRVRKGLVNPRPQIAIRQTAPGLLAVAGDNGLGSVIMMRALMEGLEVANRTGICAIGVKNSNHFGASGYYCEQAADRGYLSILLSDGPPATPPWGGREAYFGTNPLAVGIPRSRRPHIIVDFATTMAARGKIIRAADKGEQIPEGWALDKEGYPTTDSKAALEGVLLPMAGVKGYALSLAVEHLAGVFTGAGFGREVAWQYSSSEVPANVGHLMILIKADGFMGMEDYLRRTERFVEEIKSVALAPGFSEIHVPGERSWAREQSALVEGLHLDPDLLDELQEIAQELGLEL